MVRLLKKKKKKKKKKQNKTKDSPTRQKEYFTSHNNFALMGNYYIHVWYGLSMKIKLGMQSNTILDPQWISPSEIAIFNPH